MKYSCLRRKIPELWESVHHRLTNSLKRLSSTSTDDSAKRPAKRPRPKLTLPLPQIQINGAGEPGVTTHRAQTTVTEHPQLRHRVKGVADEMCVVRRGSTPPCMDHDEKSKEQESNNREVRRGTMPHLCRGISEERRSSLSHTPRAFKLRKLTLNYDRTKMKAPSQASEGTTAPLTPMMSGTMHQQALSSSQISDLYQPRIVSSPWSWSALLARHYYSLSCCKLCITLIINILLLTYKVSLVRSDANVWLPQSAVLHFVLHDSWMQCLLLTQSNSVGWMVGVGWGRGDCSCVILLVS